MLAKLRLDLTKTYEQCIAAHAIAKMVVAFAEGRDHPQSIGVEQGDIVGWDDIVVEKNTNLFYHFQVKRQQTSFSGLTAECDLAITKNASDKSLSPLDKSMKELGVWIKNIAGTSSVNRKFFLELPDSSILIKNGLEVRQFKDFLQLHINSTTTVIGLQNLQNIQNDTNTINVFNWLTSWCGYTDWAHILQVLTNFKVLNSGSETDIDSRSIETLSPVFKDVNDVLRDIKSVCLENSSYTGSITPRQMLLFLEKYLLPGIKTWTQFDNNGSTFKISGIHDLGADDEIERPSKIVPLLLSNDRVRSLKINDHRSDRNLIRPIGEIFQLALHLNGNCNALCLNWIGWKEVIRNKIGNTLGTGKADFDASMSISDNPDVNSVSEAKTLNHTQQDNFASELRNEIVKATWNLVDEKLNALVGLMNTDNSPELRNAVESRWSEWKKTLAIDLEVQKKLFTTLLYPNAEGLGIHEQLRVGPKTVLLIAEALHLLLIISVALSDNHGDWNKIENNLSINTVALSCWSGPSERKTYVRDIDDEDCVSDLIGRESCDVLIISQSKLPVSDIYNLPLDSGNRPPNSLATPHRPQLLITLNKIIKELIKKGEIKPFREYLNKLINNNKESVNESINGVTI